MLLNPLDARSPDWSPWAEMRDIADAYRMEKSLIPSVEGANNFFHIGAQDLFATLLTRIWRMPDRSLLGLLTCALVMDRKDKAKLLARTAAAKHYEGDHRSGQDVDATMSVYTQALRFAGTAKTTTVLATYAAEARDLVDAFHALIRKRDPAGLDAWIRAAVASPVASFAKGVAADRVAIAAAIEQPWSNGQTEGQICRLKTLKRQMSGRANIDLLKARMMRAA